MKKLLTLVITFVGGYAFSQASSPTGPVAAAVAATEPSWLQAHGGMMAVAVAAMLGLNAVLSGVRDLLYFYDGVAKGAAIPAQYTGLTTVNKICIWLGKILDYVQGNVAH